MSEQAQQLNRVAGNISEAIVQFCQGRKTFHAEELRNHIRAQCGEVAPASADRVLRSLRQAGKVDYRVTSRRGSLYEIVQKEAPVAVAA